MGAVDHVRWRNRPNLDRPVLVAAFEGWNDAGDAASGAVRYLIDRYDAELVAEIDPEEFFDFTSTRPQAEIDDDGVRRIVWPTTEVYAASLPGDDGDVLLLIGTEPQLRWRTFCAQITGLAQELGVPARRHARRPRGRGAPQPAGARGRHGDRPRPRRPSSGLQPSTYQGPTGVVGVLSAACREAGLPSASLWAAVPTYVPTAPSPKAVLALLEHTAEVLGVWVPTTDLEIAARPPTSARSPSWSRRTTRRPTTSPSSRSATTPTSTTAPRGRSLVEEVERFLRDRPRLTTPPDAGPSAVSPADRGRGGATGAPAPRCAARRSGSSSRWRRP